MVLGAVAAAPPPREGSFADPGRVKCGWYLLARSRALRPGTIRPVAVGRRRLLAHRDPTGRIHVTDDRCPHLGSDLSLGRVTGDGLRCRFHGWCWGPDGACTAAPGNASLPARRLRVHASAERWGFVWAWLGDAPAFPLPDVPAALRHRRALLPQRVRAHPDTIFANGFDAAHFGPSHLIDAATAAIEVSAPWSISHRITGMLPRRPPLVATGLARRTIDATFIQHGGGIVHVQIRRPLEYTIVFTIRPDPAGHSRTQTIVFLQRRRDLVRALALLCATALDDIPLMESIAWTRGFAESDAVLAQYVRFVEAMPALTPMRAAGLQPLSGGAT